MTVRLATRLLALSLCAAPAFAQSSPSPATGAARQKTRTVAKEAANSAQDATTQADLNKAAIDDLRKRVSALEAEVATLRARVRAQGAPQK